MFWITSKVHAEAKEVFASLVGAGATVHGAIKFSGGLRIDGVVHGAVHGKAGDSYLVIGHGATVIGPVDVEHAVLGGALLGHLQAVTVELLPSARVDGSICYRSLQTHAGAAVNGTLAAWAAPQESTVDSTSQVVAVSGATC